MGYVAFVLPPSERARLLDLFVPTHPDVIAHHITHVFGVSPDYPLPPPTNGAITGIVDRNSIQALVVDLGFARPDGKQHHITWSIDRSLGRKPAHSNIEIAAGYTPIPAIPISGLSAEYFR